MSLLTQRLQQTSKEAIKNDLSVYLQQTYAIDLDYDACNAMRKGIAYVMQANTTQEAEKRATQVKSHFARHYAKRG